MDSEKDSPRKNPNPENSTKGQRNTRHKQVKNVANSKAKALPVYMQSKTHISPLNSPKHNVKNGRIKKSQNNKTKTQSAQRNIIHKGALGDITTENVYEIDAYADDELGTFATFGVVPPTKKATKNRAGNKVEKRTIKRAGNTQANVRKRNTNIRLATSSEHLKRSFFENNLCALNLKAPSEMAKASSSKNHSVKEKKRQEKAMIKQQSSKAPHISIFRGIENQPEAEQWIKNKGLQTVNNDSQEYDGDVFLPTDTEIEEDEVFQNSTGAGVSNCKKNLVDFGQHQVEFISGRKKMHETPSMPVENVKHQRQQLQSTPRLLDGTDINSTESVTGLETSTSLKKSPNSLKQEIECCFGFDCSSDVDYETNLPNNRNMVDSSYLTSECLTGISPVRRASILPQQGLLPGFNTLKSPSFILAPPAPSRVQNKAKILSKNPNEDSVGPKWLSELNRKPSRFVFFKPINARLPSTSQKISTMSNDGDKMSKSSNSVRLVQEKVLSSNTNIKMRKTDACSLHERNSSEKENTSCITEIKASIAETGKINNADQGLNSCDNLTFAVNVTNNAAKSCAIAREPNTNMNAFPTENRFVALKEKSRKSIRSEKQTLQKTKPSCQKGKLNKFPNQPLIYEAIVANKDNKSKRKTHLEEKTRYLPHRAKKLDPSLFLNTSALEKGEPTKEIGSKNSLLNKANTAKRVYLKKNKLDDGLKTRRNKKTEKQIEVWETLQSSHFEDIEDTNLSFL